MAETAGDMQLQIAMRAEAARREEEQKQQQKLEKERRRIQEVVPLCAAPCDGGHCRKSVVPPLSARGRRGARSRRW